MQINRLREHRLRDVIRGLTQPVLGICLGMQLLAEASDEENVDCLGVIPGIAACLPGSPAFPVPNMGWCAVQKTADDTVLNGLANGDHFYFVHSYALPVSEITLASAEHVHRFAAIVRQGNFLAAQFHPERSSVAGARLLRGDFEQTTEYSSDPAEIARQFSDLAVTTLHLVDLDGARTGERKNRDIVAAIAAATSLELQLGGGIRDQATLAGWLDVGVQRCVIGSLALTDPDTVKAWLNKYGRHKIVLALDISYDQQREPMVTTHGWTRDSDTTLFECIEDFMNTGLQHVLCTDVSRDGAMSGPNFALYERIMTRYPQLSLQASGGVRHIEDMEQLRRLGVPAAITGRALLDRRISAEEIAAFQQNA